MTKKDYELIAEAFDSLQYANENIKYEYNERKDSYKALSTYQDVLIQTARKLADNLESTNTKFDRLKFLVAVGLTEEQLHLYGEKKLIKY